MAMTGNGNGNGQKIEALVDSVWSRLIARAAMVATPFVIAIFGWVAVEAWRAQVSASDKMIDALNKLTTTVAVIDNRVNTLERNDAARRYRQQLPQE